MKQPHAKDEAKPAEVKKADAPKVEASKPIEQKPVEAKPAKFEPKLESKDDHVAHIASLTRRMQQTQPGAESFASQILHHVAAIQNPESHNANVAAEQKAAFEAEQLSAKQRGRLPDDKAKVA